tara:strand:- start:4404 stop:4616 length:213 start_codon:yes stop_codon:yes gene_type:complete
MLSHNKDEDILNTLYEIQKQVKLTYKQETILLELYEDYQEKLKETPDDKVLLENIKMIQSYLTKDVALKN